MAGGLVVELGIDDAKVQSGLKKVSDSAKQAGSDIARNFSDGYRIASERASPENAPFGPRGAGWFPGMSGYDMAGPNGPEAMASKIAAKMSVKAVPMPTPPAPTGMLPGAAVYGAMSRNAMLGIGGGDDNAIGRRGGAIGRGIGQMGFAVQDFTSVLAQGGEGAMSRALMSTMNNVQMLGAAFGGWGIAVTAVAGAIGSLLIPKLMAGKGAFEDLADSANKTAISFREFGDRMAGMNEFKAGLGEIDSPEGEDRARKRLKLDKEGAEIRAHAAANGVAEIEKQIEAAEKMRKAVLPKLDDPFMEGVGWMVNPAKSFEAMRIDTQIAEMKKSLAVARGDFIARGKDVREAGLREDEFNKSIPGMSERSSERSELKENIRLQKEAEQIRMSVRNPLEIARDRFSDIAEAAVSGFLDPDSADRAANNAMRDFARSKGSATNLAVSGGDFGSASGFSDVLKSIRQSQGSNDPQLDVLKQNKTALDGILATLRAGLKLNPPIAQEGM